MPKDLFQKEPIDLKRVAPLQAHELMIMATCHYFEINRDQIMAKAGCREHARRKHLLFYLLKTELQMPPPEIADACETTRQNVNQAVDKMEAEVNIYLQSASDYRNIRAFFNNLQKTQYECLTSPNSSTKP